MRGALVTGATGGLGRSLAQALVRRGCRVVGIARHQPTGTEQPWDEFIAADIQRINWDNALRSCDILFHLAAHVHRPIASDRERAIAWSTNVDATEQLAGECARRRIPLIFASSVLAQSSVAKRWPAGACEHGLSKQHAEQRILHQANRGLKFVILRFPLLYGPWGRGNMERLLWAIHRRRYWPIGPGSTKKSCLFFGDAAEAMIRASLTEGMRGGTYAVAPRAPATLDDIHRHAFAAFGRWLPPSIPLPVITLATRVADTVSPYLFGRPTGLTDSARTLTADAAVDGSEFARDCGFEPVVDLAVGLKATAEWIRRNHA